MDPPAYCYDVEVDTNTNTWTLFLLALHGAHKPELLPDARSDICHESSRISHCRRFVRVVHLPNLCGELGRRAGTLSVWFGGLSAAT